MFIAGFFLSWKRLTFFSGEIVVADSLSGALSDVARFRACAPLSPRVSHWAVRCEHAWGDLDCVATATVLFDVTVETVPGVGSDTSAASGAASAPTSP